MGLLDELHASGRTIIIVTHDHMIAEHTGRTVHLLDGNIDMIQINRNKGGGAV